MSEAEKLAECQLIIAGLMKAKATPEQMVVMLNDMIDDAVAFEREACAALCDPFPGERISLDSCIEKKVRTELAANIRSRV